ncbi:MAG: 3-phosphoserine/phosphohydroxythreonine transaminase [Gammaproteobacteria bacterium]|nr:3-phosphoserine/phosphohydroxythreonine transaminase [Gammaproteobacteria bacterium]
MASASPAAAVSWQEHRARPFNFSPGPAALPQAVLEEARAEMLDYRGSGTSVMEMSHRGPAFTELAEQAESDLRELLQVPENYRVFFMHGGATMQFSAVPLNLLGDKASADYVETGAWSTKAIGEARKYGSVNVAASSADSNFNRVPPLADWKLDSSAAYLHVCSNETIGGVQFHDFPEVEVPLVADMSSELLSRPIDVARFGLIYAGAQKNLGPAGLALVIVRDDLIGRARQETPSLLDYAVNARFDCMYNTPPTYAWYIAGLVFRWVKAQGGIAAMAERNAGKAARLYACIDGSNFYRSPVPPENRSIMNVPFTLCDPSLDGEFLRLAGERGLLNLKGHRSVGGMRASLYNAVPEAAVDALVEFMTEFQNEYG